MGTTTFVAPGWSRYRDFMRNGRPNFATTKDAPISSAQLAGALETSRDPAGTGQQSADYSEAFKQRSARRPDDDYPSTLDYPSRRCTLAGQRLSLVSPGAPCGSRMLGLIGRVAV